MTANKFWVALVTTVVIAALQFVVDTGNWQEWSTVIVSLIGALGVYAVPNKPKTNDNALVGGR